MDEQEQTIDLRVLLKVFTEHLLPILLAFVLAAAAGFSLAKFIIPKKYTSEALMYVENSSDKSDNSNININDLSVAQKLVNTCQILFTSNYVLDELSISFNGVYEPKELDGMIKVESVNNTEVLRISVDALSPQEAFDICTRLTELATTEFQRVIKSGSIETVDKPTLPERHTFPSALQFTAIGGALGLVLTYLFFLVVELLDIKVKPDDDLAQMYEIPVFAEILDFETASKAGYSKYAKYSSYERNSGKDLKLYDDADDEDEDEDNDEDDDRGAGGVKAANGKEEE